MASKSYLQAIETNTTIIEVVESGQQGGKGLDGRGVPAGGTTGQILNKKSDTDYDTEWTDYQEGESVIPVRGGAVPLAYDSITNYIFNDRVSFNSKEYRGLTATTGAFNPANWIEVSTQNNELRLSSLESQPDLEYEFSQTVQAGGIWIVTNIGNNQAEFDSDNIQIFFNGVKLRKGVEAVWVSPTELRVTFTSVAGEDYLKVVVTSQGISNPTEQEYTETKAVLENWTVSNIGDNPTQFNNTNLKIYFNGLPLRKNTEVIWISSTELQITYQAVAGEDYLTIRNDV